jgi:hypothetical protein
VSRPTVVAVKAIVSLIAMAFLVGCVSSSAEKTTTYPDGRVVKDKIRAGAFLGDIHNGSYANGDGMTLTVTDATPDQQSISILAGAVVDIAKMAMTNGTPKTVSTNVIVLPTNSAATLTLEPPPKK